MSRMPIHKYKPFAPIHLPDRRWPGRVIERAPLFCSVDLRDGNQALVEPMGLPRKRTLWHELVRMGFKEIEVGFPSASQPDFDFVRTLIDQDLIPDDVTIQVLTQARPDLIDRTFEAIRGAKQVIVHVYNSTSTLQREVVFCLDRAGIRDIAVRAVQRIRQLTETIPETKVVLEYSPESFTGTELDFAKDICDAVVDSWGATSARKVILNLPATVEMATPNLYADQIEWMHRHLARRDAIVLSVHPHNDRGTAVAAAELAVMAGAERVEGTLFGNGERTGNVDVVTLALNLFSQGIDPGLDLRDIDALKRVVEHVNRLPVHPRHPYAGELVYTAFSGSHQDAIKKGLSAQARRGDGVWQVPYLPIDPSDVGRSYEAVIRVNSQSGKGGVAYIMQEEFGFTLPRELAVALSQHVQRETERTEAEISPGQIFDLFQREFVAGDDSVQVLGYQSRAQQGREHHQIEVVIDREPRTLGRMASGPVEAAVDALAAHFGIALDVVSFAEHALKAGADAQAVAYICLQRADGSRAHGVGVHGSTVMASLHAIATAVSRLREGAEAVVPKAAP